jgi:DNA-binding FadR family transcriptional regulator
MNEQAFQNLGQTITRKLGSAIIRGDYGANAQLPTEMQLSERFGVSRGAVREAIKVLAAKGLVTSRRRQGTRVTNPGDWNLLDPEILNWMQTVEYSHQLLHELVQVRLAVEPEAAAIVAERRELVDFSHMSKALRELEREQQSEAELMDADVRFHLGILEATGNRFYRQMCPLIETTLAFGHELIDTIRVYGDLGRIIAADHRQLFEAMLDGRGDESRDLARIMVSTVLGAVEGALREQGD